MRQTSLPALFNQYVNRVDYVQRRGRNRWSSTCPKCGGLPHSDGALPDRCVWWIDQNPQGHCFQCGTTFKPDGKSNGDFTAEEIAANERRRQALEDQDRREYERKFARMVNRKQWQVYHDTMTAEGYEYWVGRGFSREWVDYWQYGWRREWRFGQHVTPSATIPIFAPNGQCVSIRHRLVNPPPNVGKYLPEFRGLPAALWYAHPSAGIAKRTLMVEGELKAAYCAMVLGNKKLSIVGIPGKNPSPAIIATLRQAEHLTVVLDPDAEEAAERLINALGKSRCHVPEPLDGKIDDYGLAHNWTAQDLSAYLKTAHEQPKSSQSPVTTSLPSARMMRPFGQLGGVLV